MASLGAMAWSTFRASAVTSGPVPSPAITAIFVIVIEFGFWYLGFGVLCPDFRQQREWRLDWLEWKEKFEVVTESDRALPGPESVAAEYQNPEHHHNLPCRTICTDRVEWSKPSMESEN